jgi:uncharacterized protein (TIGR02145 family)
MSFLNSFCTVIVASIFWIALNCTNNPVGPDVDAVSADESQLVITYAPGDSASSVTGNVVLPATGLNGSTISWATDNESRITIEGIVSRPAASSGDASVKLTATILKGIASIVKVFTLTVKNESYTGNIMNAEVVTDIDGNVYWSVKIGDQIWTVDNLRTTKYNDGTPIPYVKDSAVWVSLNTPGYCYFNNIINPDRIRKYGMLYNWYAVDTKKLAPAGWHIPTDAEWDNLKDYLVASGYNWDGTTDSNKIAKSLAAKTDWYTTTGLDAGTIGSDLTTNNTSGFLALPGGSRNTDGNFDFGGSGNWWSATEYNASGAVARNLYYDYGNLMWNSNYKSCGFSVRLIKD